MIVLSCCLLLPSCDLNDPTNRFLDSSAQEPRVVLLDSVGIRSGQHLAGTVMLEVPPISLNSPITSVSLIVDDSLQQRAFSPPYTFQLDTRLQNQGEHLLSIAVTETNPQIGLLGATGFPSFIFSANVVFDQAPPSPVTLQSVVWENGHPRLSWTRNNDLNFYAYALTEESNWSGENQIATITDQSTTTYVDTTIPMFYGIKSTYHTDVSNRNSIVPSNGVDIRFGDTLPAAASPGPRPIMNAAGTELYTLSPYPNDIITAMSTTDRTILRTRPMSSFSCFALSRDGSQIYVVSFSSNTFTILNAATFGVVRTSTLPFNVGTTGSIVAGRPNRVYMTSGSFATGNVKVIDANTGVVVREITTQAPDGLLAISPDNNNLYIASGTSVYNVDVTTDSVRIITQRTASSPVRSMQLGSDGTRLYLGHVYAAPSNYVDVWTADSLASITQITVPDQLWDFFVTSSSVYLSESITGGRYFLSGRVVQYDVASLTPQTFWDFWKSHDSLSPQVHTTSCMRSGQRHLPFQSTNNVEGE